MRSRGAAALAMAMVLLPLGCSSTGDDGAKRPISTPAPTDATLAPTTTTAAPARPGGSTPVSSAPAIDQDVTFESGGLTIHGSLRLPSGASGNVPAVLLLAGSGPTDRNGDSTQVQGTIGTLSWLADQFEAQGVASLRYDKLGTGETGLGDFASRPTEIDFDVFVDEARDALKFLADQPGVDATRLILGGHSEGGLIAMVVASEPTGGPTATGVALFAPPSARYLDLVTTQVKGQTAAAVAAGAMTSAQAASFDDQVDAAVRSVRTGTPLPADTPKELASIFNPTTTRFLQEADAVDPAALAAALRPRGVLLVCAEKDIQVPCAGVQALQEHFRVSTFVSLANTDHVLKDIGARRSDGSEYTEDLPFSADLEAPLGAFVSGLG